MSFQQRLRQRRRQQVLMLSLLTIALIITLLPGPQHLGHTAKAVVTAPVSSSDVG